MGFKSVSVIKQLSQDTGEFTRTIVVFNRVITKNDYWDILGNYTHGFPEWLNDELFEFKSYTDEETGNAYSLEEELMIEL